MGKQEFINQLRRSLSSIQDYIFVNDTISYYENYIESQIRMGKTEEEVMQELGDPRLIAKSICATHVNEAEDSYANYQEFDDGSFSKKSNKNETILRVKGKQILLPSWLMKILTILVVGVVLFLVFTILSWLAPFIFLGVLVYMIYRLIVGRSS